MRFLVDAMLPPALAAWITDRGHEAQHVSELGLLAAKDSLIWGHALRESCVLITKDQDFSQRRATAGAGPQIVWLRFGNVRRLTLMGLFAASFAEVVATLERGDAVVEVTGGAQLP